MGLRSLATDGQSLRLAYRNEFLSRWTTQVCTIARDHTELTASGRPVRPSQTTMHTSAVPRFLISDKTWCQYLAPSPPSASPSAMAIRSSWDKNLAEMGRSVMTILPESINHSEPQLVDTSTRRAAAAP